MPKACTLVLTLAYLLFACTTGFAQDAPQRLPIAPDTLPLPLTEWYGAYLRGQKVGFMSSSLSRQGSGQTATYRMEQHLQITVVSFGQKNALEVSSILEFGAAAPYPLVRASYVEKRGNQDRTI